MLVRFQKFELDAQRYQLSRAGRVVKLERIPMELLLFLVEQRGMLVSREAIVERLWGKDVFLEAEHSVNTAINKVRSALQDDLADPQFIQTVKGKGYRFIAQVEVCDTPVPAVEAQIAALSPAVALIPEGEFRTSGEGPPATASRAVIEDGPTELDTRQSLESSEPQEFVGDEALPDGSTPSAATKRSFWRPALAVFAIAAVLCTALLVRILSQRKADAPLGPNANIHSLAVLPFINLSHDAEHEYFVDGMTDQLITDLAQMKSMRVISRTSVMQYKEVRRPLPEIAQALNVDAVVEGSVQYSGHRVRITAQLLDARHDRHLWAHTYDRDQGELLALQTDVTRDISSEIVGEFGVSRQTTLSRNHVESPEAYDAYLRGRYFWNKRDLQSIQKSIEYYDRAIQADPQYALAYAGLADSYSVMSDLDSWGRAKAVSNAELAAQKALQLDGSLAQPHATLASLKQFVEFDWTGAEKEFRQAIALNPSYATAHQWYSNYLSLMNRHDEAILEAQRALELDPLSLIINAQMGWAFYYARRYDEAIAQLKKTLDLDSTFTPARHRLAAAYELKGMHGAAIAELQKMGKGLDENAAYLALLGYAYAHSGNLKEAERMRARITLHPPAFGDSDLALIYTGLGDNDKAFESLHRARAAREVVGVRADPLFDPLHSDPRFQELFRTMNFPE